MYTNYYNYNNQPPNAYLIHYGVKGMKWGVRHDNPSSASRRVRKQAKKDAKEFARAKMVPEIEENS